MTLSKTKDLRTLTETFPSSRDYFIKNRNLRITVLSNQKRLKIFEQDISADPKSDEFS